MVKKPAADDGGERCQYPEKGAAPEDPVRFPVLAPPARVPEQVGELQFHVGIVAHFRSVK